MKGNDTVRQLIVRVILDHCVAGWCLSFGHKHIPPPPWVYTGQRYKMVGIHVLVFMAFVYK